MSMKRVIILALVVGTATLLSSCASRYHGSSYYTGGTPGIEPAVDLWPVRYVDDSGISFTIFEPVCDSWDGHQLRARCAVAVQSPLEPLTTYGVLTFSALTLVDKSTHTATLADFKMTRANFPSDPEQTQTQRYQASLMQNFPKHAPALALERLTGSLSVAPPPKADELNNTPPKIIVATRPAVLVCMDGPPAWRAVPGTDLQRVINTRMLVLKDATGKCYLRLFDGYLQAAALDGPWTVASQPPAGAATAEKQAADSGAVDLMAGTPDAVTHKMPSLHQPRVPDVFVATQPSELIQFRGEAQYAAIPGTDLLYAVNTTGNVFKSLKNQQNYILISGRWYKAPSLDGPWRFVPGSHLPRDFANIPDNSPKENVKASVPGTQQATEALIANSIPQSIAVARTNRMAAPQFDGAMQLAPIAGTPLHYIVNSATPIIEVDPQTWYACQDGVWYSFQRGDWPVGGGDRCAAGDLYDTRQVRRCIISLMCRCTARIQTWFMKATPRVIWARKWPMMARWFTGRDTITIRGSGRCGMARRSLGAGASTIAGRRGGVGDSIAALAGAGAGAGRLFSAVPVLGWIRALA